MQILRKQKLQKMGINIKYIYDYYILFKPYLDTKKRKEKRKIVRS